MPLVLNGTTGVQDNSGAFVRGTAVASTSGTSIDFTSIPSWVKRVTVMFNGVGTNATSPLQIQLGSSTFTTSGYLGAGTYTASSSTSTLNSAGFVFANWVLAANIGYGSIILSNITGNSWTATGFVSTTNQAATFLVSGLVPLSGVLDRVRITTVSGTSTFNAGSINILYE
jgi:hypothetical protein